MRVGLLGAVSSGVGDIVARCMERADVCRLVDSDVAGLDFLLLSTPWPRTQSALREFDLAGKIIIDSTERLQGRPACQGDSGPSAGESVASWAPGAYVVKICQTSPLGGRRPKVFMCGDHPHAKAAARDMLSQLGFETVDAGPLSQARWLERFSALWEAAPQEVASPRGLFDALGVAGRFAMKCIGSVLRS